MAEKLLAEFSPVSTAEWEAAIAKDLKGADYEKKLVWRTPEGLAVRPYYRAEDIAALDWIDAAPGEFPYVRAARADGGWHIRETIEAADPAEANRAACAAVAAGAEEIAFGQAAIGNVSDLALLFAHLDEIPIHIANTDEPLLRLLIEFLDQHPRAATVSTSFDPLGNVEFAAEILASAPSNFVPFTIGGAARDEASANAVEEIGVALAAGADFLAAMDERNIKIDHTASALEFSFAIGTNYFVEIARLRAFRMLWARVVESFGGSLANARARIAAHTALRDEAAGDLDTNILRATTEAMAAIAGSADSISVAPFDARSRQPDEASRRLARNTQLLLKHEAHFARVADPGGGSYCLETMTGSIASAAWKAMQGIEAAGGYRKVHAVENRNQELGAKG